jgi:hypothetical protein
MQAFNVVLLMATISGNEAMQSLRQGSSGAPKTAIGAIAGKLPVGFSLSTCDADGNDVVTWKELYDTLAEYKIPNLDTQVVKGLVTEFNVDGPKEGADAGLDKAEFAKMVAMFKKKAANALIPKDPNEFDTGCYMEDDKGETYRGLLSSTISGRTCQKWTAEKPHTVGIEPTEDNGLGTHNFCRNPDGSEEKPWCFTMDPNEDHAKELCEVPKCAGLDRAFDDEADKLAVDIAKGLACHCMDQHYGSTTTTADTAVPLTLLAHRIAQAKKEFGAANVELAKKRCKCGHGQVAVLK